MHAAKMGICVLGIGGIGKNQQIDFLMSLIISFEKIDNNHLYNGTGCGADKRQ
jgi:hypothetical protein